MTETLRLRLWSCQVEGPISEKSYLDGSIFGNNASQAVPANILAINASSTTSFYGPTVAKKFGKSDLLQQDDVSLL